MAERFDDEPDHGDGRDRERGKTAGLGAQRLRVVLLVLTLFGAPLILMVSYLWMRNAAFLPPFGDQPGGEVVGVVTLEDGSPAADAPVHVFLHRRDTDPESFERAKTDESGRFAVKVPPLDGCYTVVVGGGTWVATRHEISLEDGEPDPLEVTLEPGCEVVLDLERRDGQEIRAGDYEMVRAAQSFLPVPSAALAGEFEGARLTCDGLPPGQWTLRLRLDDGTEAEYSLELEPGRNELALPPF